VTSPPPTGTSVSQQLEVPSSPFPSAVTTETSALPVDDKLKSRVWGNSGDNPLRIQATTDKNNTNSNTNNITIKVYNMSKEDLGFITTAVSYRRISLRAGYKSIIENAQVDEYDALPEIFTGEIVDITSEDTGIDLITTITAKDSAVSIRNVKISKVFPKGSAKKDIIKSLVNSWDGVIFTNNSISDNAKFISSSFTSEFTASGVIANILDELVKDENLNWYILNKIFFLINKTEPKLVRKVILSPNDVVGTPTSVQRSNLNAGSPQGLNITIFLNGAVDIDTVVTLKGFEQLNGRDIDGDYNVRSLSHELDNRGKPWFSKLTIGAR
jgi:hypothetical protein